MIRVTDTAAYSDDLESIESTKAEYKEESATKRQNKARKRASDFKARFPDVPNVPDFLSSNVANRLINDHNLDKSAWTKFRNPSMKMGGPQTTHIANAPPGSSIALRTRSKRKEIIDKEAIRQETEEQRAREFKARFPHIPDVPDKLSGRVLNRLVKNYQLDTTGLGSGFGKRA